jgi:REP element-mobilizing transposase RayT
VPRRKRLIIAGQAHLVRQRLWRWFSADRQVSAYLKALRTAFAGRGVQVRAWSALPDAVHFVLVPPQIGAFGAALAEANGLYGKWRNRADASRGPVFRRRFECCAVDREWLLEAARLAERLPVIAYIVDHPIAWADSSARYNAGLLAEDRLAAGPPLGEEVADWMEWLRGGEFDRERRLFDALDSGRPVGGRRWRGRVAIAARKKLRTL